MIRLTYIMKLSSIISYRYKVKKIEKKDFLVIKTLRTCFLNNFHI